MNKPATRMRFSLTKLMQAIAVMAVVLLVARNISDWARTPMVFAGWFHTSLAILTVFGLFRHRREARWIIYGCVVGDVLLTAAVIIIACYRGEWEAVIRGEPYPTMQNLGRLIFPAGGVFGALFGLVLGGYWRR